MKKLLALVLALCMVFALCACGSTTAPAATAAPAATEAPATEAPAADPSAKGEGVLTYDEYLAAELDTQVVIETYVQNTQTWWDGKASFYTQDESGAYFIYNMPCTEEEYAAISVPGTKLRVTGYKSEWAGEVEIVDATFEVLEGSYLAAPVNVSWSLDALESYMNQLVKFDDMTVEAISFKNGEPGDDIYVTLSKDGVSYEFCVEAYCATTQPNSDVYAAVSGMQVGDLVTVTAFLYWYNGADAHIQTVLFG